MSDFLHELEPRRLFSGGIDPTFGSSAGAIFTPPANATVMDSTVDSAGRMILVGMVDLGPSKDNGEIDQMFIARLNSAGQLDPSFFGGGISQGTPRGITQLTHVTALAEGGYIASGITGTDNNDLIRFTAAGKIDTSYGHNGVRAVRDNVQDILERPDHSLLVIGNYTTFSGEIEDPTDNVNYAAHITPKGALDTAFGEDGYANLGNYFWTDDEVDTDNSINSATLDSAGRLLLGVDTNVSDPGNSDADIPESGQSAISINRFNTDGSPDPTFIDGQQSSPPFKDQVKVADQKTTNNFADQINGLIVSRPDGKTVALSVDQTASPQVIGLTLLNATGNADQSKLTVDLSKAAPKFSLPAPSYRDMLALPDNSILIAGATISGSKQTPAIIKLKPDLSVDTSFGTGGILTFGTAGSDQSAGTLQLSDDGTVYAVSGTGSGGERSGNITSVRIFANDDPIVRLHKAKPFGDTERITVTISGDHPIDTSSLDDQDLRLVAAGSGDAKKLRFLRFTSNPDGTVTAIYRIDSNLLSAGAYSITAIAGQILDNQNDGNAQTVLGALQF